MNKKVPAPRQQDFIYMMGEQVVRGRILETLPGNPQSTRILLRNEHLKTNQFFWVPTWQIVKALAESKTSINHARILEGF